MIIAQNKKLMMIINQAIANSISTNKMKKYLIQSYQVGQRLDRYLKKLSIGWTAGQKWLRKKDIVIQKQNGTFINQSDYRIQQGDTLLISSMLEGFFNHKQQKQQRIVPVDEAVKSIDKMLVFDNQNLSILNKLPGYSVQGGSDPKKNIFSLMCSKYKKQMIYITHRLDQVTSGLVLVAKNKQTAQKIQISMEQRSTFNKYYLALTQGKKILKNHGFIRSNVEWSSKNKARLCSQTSQKSKDCITFYTPIEPSYNQDQKLKLTKQDQIMRNLIGIKLLTGRKHQIRCHLSSYLDQPILNDSLYGGKKCKQLQNQQAICLHAFGVFIQSNQIIRKINTANKYLNENLGSIKFLQNGILFTGNLPSYWPNSKRIDLQTIALNIQSLHKNCRQQTPKKRNLSSIL